MKKFRLVLMALAVLSFTAFYSCDGGKTEEATNSEEVTTEVKEATEEVAAEENVELTEEQVVDEENGEEVVEETTEEVVE